MHATDATNASRTMLFNIHTQQWDEELLDLFKIPSAILPTVQDCSSQFGVTQQDLFGATIPITGMAGDQQAATIGQACFKAGMVKSTYGTGCFMLLNTGEQAVTSQNRLLTTIAYRINGKVTYGLEGSIFAAGAAVQWLKDTLHFIKQSSETEALARSIENTGGVYLVPAFTGLGAPYWNPDARGAVFGLTRDTGIAEIVRATLEAMVYQSRDLMDAMLADYQGQLATLRIDGGMAKNNWLLQFLADILNVPVERPQQTETTVKGAAALAGLGAGLYRSLEEISHHWQLNASFTPSMDAATRAQFYDGWQRAVAKVNDGENLG